MLKESLAIATLLAVSQFSYAANYTINVSGTFLADNSELDNPVGPNYLSHLHGVSFTGSFALNNDPDGLNANQYIKEINSDNVSWSFHSPYGAVLNVPNAGFVASGVGALVENDYYYDGSEGVAPAGYYDYFELFAWSPDTSCSNCSGIDWGETTPLITGVAFGLGLDGYSNMLLGSSNLGISSDLSNVLFGQIDLRQYNNGQLVGYVSTGWGPVSGSLSGLTVTPVPEPETYALLLAGLGLVGFAARRRKHS